MGPAWPCSVQLQPQSCPEPVPLIASPNCTLGCPRLLTSHRETHNSRDRKPATNAAYVGLVLPPRQTLQRCLCFQNPGTLGSCWSIPHPACRCCTPTSHKILSKCRQKQSSGPVSCVTSGHGSQPLWQPPLKFWYSGAQVPLGLLELEG